MSRATYDQIGVRYAPVRQPEPSFEAAVVRALGNIRTVLNVGAGTGSYEPVDRAVTAVEPSAEMIRQRPHGAAPVIQAHAEALPFGDDEFDAALAVLTVHHWTDLDQGLDELLRVTKKRIVIVTIEVDVLADLWLVRDYFPEALDIHAARMPPISELVEKLPGITTVEPLPIPRACRDGFFAALWDRPEACLDPDVRRASSVWHDMSDKAAQRGLRALERDLSDGSWQRHNRRLQNLDSLDTGLRLLTTHLP